MASRPQIIGPEAGPEKPYPYKMEGKVISGFGRGSKELGIPTANLPVDDALTPWIANIPSGVYFGYASLALPASHPDKPPSSSAADGAFSVFPMVMSIGYNPFYKNTVRSAEVHILHKFGHDFYDAHMRLLILGFIREEKDYKSLEALIEDINFDCEVAKKSLAREAWGWDKGVGEDAEWFVKPL
ncbi:hypothetical protein TRIATDRAFT_146288 [Trichoderma atroviride IMI 206040]|uniref:Riboflavin kinase n=1 Tax=Hypocrea atroviridis (strain ATCC 20476 / IMI 206040) TaxID=452589 RepID=G9NXW7_HYPAI|nr:uncharacterized protein TRIATDRAFT_146288 [Trichoderma atroviride IMI 206040]EHK44296.1 hypothetical protein TRIATDRAFT_146288 [Trichoderma atroviride IMI 206040]